MNHHTIPFPEEQEHLEVISDLLEKAVQKSIARVERHEQDYRESKKYMAEYRHEIDPKEIFQNELALKDIEHAEVIALREHDRLMKLVDSPYFARIDFQEEGEEAKEVCYIGRFTFAKGYHILIFDWRAPIAGMFYECRPGRAGYEAPSGRIEGTLLRKRQFKITEGQIEYAFESSLNIRDEVLQRELGTTSDEKMKTIITTLQKEQNRIIRNESGETLVIQGAAGSGKTSVALHRIAYLLYKYKDTLSAQNIVILSPNKVFGDFISNVLPELGEEPVYEMSFAEIAEIQLEGVIGFERPNDPLEYAGTGETERGQFKSSLDFIMQLDEYMSKAENEVFDPVDYSERGFAVAGAWIWRRYKAYHSLPVRVRLREIAEDIHEKFVSENVMEDEVPGKKMIQKALNRMLRIKDALCLYERFYDWIGRPDLLVMPGKKILEWSDVYPFMYLYAFFEGLQENRTIHHLVIDEMQDYTPIQYEVMNLLFKCQKTILGDFGQAIHPCNQNTLACLKQIYGEETVVELKKSYRSSYEIISFARRIIPEADLEPVERHGEAPCIIRCDSEEKESRMVRKCIDVFHEGAHASLGIIMKNNRDAKALYEGLKEREGVTLISPESDRFMTGVMITSVQMSKGLEFDEVIIPQADDHTYNNEMDRKLLYVACTRAMHKLTIISSGTISRLLPSEYDIV